MKIDFNRQLQDLDGEDLRETSAVVLVEENGQITRQPLQGKLLDLKRVCATALNGKYQGEELSPDQHVERFSLALKIFNSNGDGIELKTEEIALIKTLLAKSGYTPIVVGQACQILEGKIEPEQAIAATN